MSQEPDANDKELLESIRRGLRKSVAFWSPENKVEREIYAVRTLLQHLGIEHDPKEIRLEPAEPPDINFRDARFEIKEVLDESGGAMMSTERNLKKRCVLRRRVT